MQGFYIPSQPTFLAIQPLKWPPNTLTSLYLCPCIIPCPGDSFPINRIWQKWWDTASKIRYKNPLASVLLAFSWFLSCFSDGSHLPCCELPYREVYMTGNWGRPPVSSEPVRSWGPQSNGLKGTKSCLQSWKWSGKQIFPQRSLEMVVAPANTWLQPCERPWARGASQARPDSRPTQTDHKCVLS